MNPRAILISICVSVFFASALYAQQNTATVTGTVRDSSGAAVPAASITLENINRGVTRTATSDSSGFFSFDFVVIGTYRLTVTQSGFASTVRSGLDLTAGQVLDLPLQLELQQQKQTVEVMAEAAALDTTSVQQTAGREHHSSSRAPRGAPRLDQLAGAKYRHEQADAGNIGKLHQPAG